MREVFVGCCGWQEAKARYFEHFPVVELQETFYQPPPLDRVTKWRAQAPADFRFSLKSWQLITHTPASPTYRKLKEPVAPDRRDAFGSFRQTVEVREAWRRTLEVARAAQAAAVVFQCPASFTETGENLANLEAFFRTAEREGRLFAFEPRGPWRAEVVRELCARLDLVHCTDPFQSEPVSAGPVYLRLHGRGGYRYQYTDAELGQLRELVRRYRAEGRQPMYVLFNNSHMKEDALRFTRAMR